jgi:hypothetical protein
MNRRRSRLEGPTRIWPFSLRLPIRESAPLFQLIVAGGGVLAKKGSAVLSFFCKNSAFNRD